MMFCVSHADMNLHMRLGSSETDVDGCDIESRRQGDRSPARLAQMDEAAPGWDEV